MSSSSSNGSHSKTLVQIAAKNRHQQKCGYPVQTSSSSPSITKAGPKLQYLHHHQGSQVSSHKRRGVSAEPLGKRYSIFPIFVVSILRIWPRFYSSVRLTTKLTKLWDAVARTCWDTQCVMEKCFLFCTVPRETIVSLPSNVFCSSLSSSHKASLTAPNSATVGPKAWNSLRETKTALLMLPKRRCHSMVMEPRRNGNDQMTNTDQQKVRSAFPITGCPCDSVTPCRSRLLPINSHSYKNLCSLWLKPDCAQLWFNVLFSLRHFQKNDFLFPVSLIFLLG